MTKERPILFSGPTSKAGIPVAPEMIREKVGDTRRYLYLLGAMVEETVRKGKA